MNGFLVEKLVNLFVRNGNQMDGKSCEWWGGGAFLRVCKYVNAGAIAKLSASVTRMIVMCELCNL